MVQPRVPSLCRVRDREIVFGVAGSVVAAAIVPPLLVAGPSVLVAVGVWRERAATSMRERSLEAALPDMIDQLGLAVSAGLSLPAALRTISPWLPGSLREVVSGSLDRLDAGAPVADVFVHLGRGLPPSGRRPIAVIVAATRDGAPLGPNLARAAAEARDVRRRSAQTRARRLPVLMLLPLVLCVLPAFVLLTLVPLVASSLDGLSLSDSFPPP
ncbi:MAG: type II secretion system F family protein [Actinomycetota bacterium]